MDPAAFAAACEKEIEELHAFFVAWFAGRVPATDAAWSRVTKALAPGFAIVAPSGELLDRESISTGIRGQHGAHGPDTGFRIWTRAFQARHIEGRQAIVTYEEWQLRGGEELGRLSTAVFRASEEAPNGVHWLHVHETWLPGAAPSAT